MSDILATADGKQIAINRLRVALQEKGPWVSLPPIDVRKLAAELVTEIHEPPSDTVVVLRQNFEALLEAQAALTAIRAGTVVDFLCAELVAAWRRYAPPPDTPQWERIVTIGRALFALNGHWTLSTAFARVEEAGGNSDELARTWSGSVADQLV